MEKKDTSVDFYRDKNTLDLIEVLRLNKIGIYRLENDQIDTLIKHLKERKFSDEEQILFDKVLGNLDSSQNKESESKNITNQIQKANKPLILGIKFIVGLIFLLYGIDRYNSFSVQFASAFGKTDLISTLSMLIGGGVLLSCLIDISKKD